MSSLKDVAKMADVSLMTVSRVINNYTNVKPQTREKVLKAIDHLEYKPNLLARSLVTKSTKTIGILFSNIYNQVYLEEIMGIESVAAKEGYSIIISNVNDYESAHKGLSILLNKQVDGVIILPMELQGINTSTGWQKILQEIEKLYTDFEQIATSYKATKPFVIIGYNACKGVANRIFHDYAQGTSIAVDYLCYSGHKDIMLISSVSDKGIWKDRYDAYIKAMNKNGLRDYIRVELDENSVEGGYEAMNRIIAHGKLPEAIYSGNDLIAIGVIRALSEAGYKVPKDISVIGHDGIQLGEMIVPRLTSISLNSFKIGECAMNFIVDRLNGVNENEKLEDQLVEQKLVIRNSVAKSNV